VKSGIAIASIKSEHLITGALAESPTFGIARILQDGRFVVPSHQRDYCWTKDEVQQLFDDVADAMEKKADSYFLF
jgi:uncharacterized protein with ParB-like and HNH nuclease domain